MIFYVPTYTLILLLWENTDQKYFQIWTNFVQRVPQSLAPKIRANIMKFPWDFCVSGGKKCLFFVIFCVRTKWMLLNLFCNIQDAFITFFEALWNGMKILDLAFFAVRKSDGRLGVNELKYSCENYLVR